MTTQKKNIYSLISPQDDLGYKIDLFDLAESVPSHYHKIQTQYLVVLEGNLGLSLKDQKIDLKAGDFIAIPPNTEHGIHPQSSALFVAIDIPGFTYPEDVYNDPAQHHETLKPFVYCQKECIINSEINLINLAQCVDMPEAKHQRKIVQPGYTVYPLATDPNANKWELAILDIIDSPKHFHKHGIEHFLVLNGELAIELNEVRHTLQPGHSAHIPPGVIHHLKSTTREPVRVLCMNFPAFDMSDFYGVEQ